jgi:hypothetical protein
MARIFVALFSLLTVHAAAAPGTAGSGHPGMYLDAGEVAAIRTRVKAGADPWAAAYARLIVDADKALNYRPFSVTFGGKGPAGGDIHDYWTDAPYTGSRDGIINPVNDRTDYFAASGFTKTVRNLGLAWALTGDARYAEKAITLLRTWMLNPATRMNPRFTNDQSHIELSTAMPAAFYGIDLLWDFPGWKPAEREAVAAWARALGKHAQTWSATNNFENWRHVLMASAGVLSRDSELQNTAFEAWKAFMASGVDADGRFIHELDRTKSLGYSAFALNALVQTAEIARHAGVDLYSYRLADGRDLGRCLDYHATFLRDPKQWAFPQIEPYDGENAAIYEIALLRKQRPAYREVIRRWGRPMTEIRILGPVTLTHAFGPL